MKEIKGYMAVSLLISQELKGPSCFGVREQRQVCAVEVQPWAAATTV